MVFGDDCDVSTERSEIELLYRSDGARIERSLVGAFGSREIAAEATAEAFAQLIRRGSAVRSPGAWVWRSAFAIARGLAAQTSPESIEVKDVGVLDAEYPVDLLAALAELTVLQRQAVVLHHYAGFRLSEIAEITGSSPGALKVHLSRARRKLRKKLGAHA